MMSLHEFLEQQEKKTKFAIHLYITFLLRITQVKTQPLNILKYSLVASTIDSLLDCELHHY